MGFLAPEQQMWVIQPLVEAGLDLEQITGLVFRLAFEGVAAEGVAVDLDALVSDQASEVQAAWRATLGRMLILDLDLRAATEARTPADLI